MTAELPKRYEPAELEGRLYASWESSGSFSADPQSDKPAYTIVLPPPNVTGSLHVGHALTAAVQDTLVRFKAHDRSRSALAARDRSRRDCDADGR